LISQSSPLSVLRVSSEGLCSSLLQQGQYGMPEGCQHGQAAQLVEARQLFRVRGQQGAGLVEQHQLAVAGKGQLADEGGEPLDTGIQPDHCPAVIALHRQGHARLPGGEEEVGVGHYDAGVPACLLVPAAVAGIEAVLRHGASLQQPLALIKIEKFPPTLTQALDQQTALGGRIVQRPFRPFGQLAHQEEITIVITHIDGAIAAAVGQHFSQLGQKGEACLQVRHGRELTAAQEAQ